MIRKHNKQVSNTLIPKDSFFHWIDTLRSDYRVFGPFMERGQSIFKEISSSKDLFMEYPTTMLSPGKLFIYKPKEDILKFRVDGSSSIEEVMPPIEKQVIVGVHPCDINAILYLDAHFSHAYADPYFKARRDNTVLIALNCMPDHRGLLLLLCRHGPAS